VVDSETVEKGKALYDALGVPAANIDFEDRSGPAAKAGHSWVTEDYGGACDANASPSVARRRFHVRRAERLGRIIRAAFKRRSTRWKYKLE
jgi:hypothetical protein